MTAISLNSAMNFRKTRIQDNVLNLELLQRTEAEKRQSPNNRGQTLVLFFGWLGAEKRGLERYFKLYWELGYDVLFIPGNVRHFMWYPTAKEFAITLLDYLVNNDEIADGYEHFMVHSISIGSYMFVVCLNNAHRDLTKYHSFLNAIKGVVYDSITYGSFEHMQKGVASGLTQSAFLRAMITNILPVVFYIFKRNTVDAFTENMHVIEESPQPVPTLFYYSRNDPLCEPTAVDNMVDGWKRKWNFPIIVRSWDKSKHAGHLKLHPQDYIETFDKFVQLYTHWISYSSMRKFKSKL